MLNNIENIKLIGIKRARVVNNASPELDGSIELHIPDIMQNYDETITGELESVENYIKGSLAGSSEGGYMVDDSPYQSVDVINKRGCKWARPVFLSNDEQDNFNSGFFKVPKNGSWVYMFFEDGDIKKPYWLPFSPTLNDKTIEKSWLKDSATTRVDPVKMPNIDVIDSWCNGTIIYYDENPEVNSLFIKLGTGHMMRIIENDAKSVMQLVTSKKQEITIDDKADEIYVHANSHIRLDNDAGSYVDMKDGNIVQKASRIDLNP